MSAKKVAKGVKKIKHQSKKFDKVRFIVRSTPNNTFVSVTDNTGNLLSYGSCGMIYRDGPRKSTSEAAREVVRRVFNKLNEKKISFSLYSIQLIDLGPGRDAACEEIQNCASVADTSVVRDEKAVANGEPVKFVPKSYLVSVSDKTKIPHGGCRPKKKRRV